MRYVVFRNVTPPDRDQPPRWEKVPSESWVSGPKIVEAGDPWNAVITAYGGPNIDSGADGPRLGPGEYEVYPVEGSAAFGVGLEVRPLRQDGEPVPRTPR